MSRKVVNSNPMFAWWNSIEFLSLAKFWLGYAAVVGAILVILNQVVALRLDALRATQARPRVLTEQQRETLVARLREAGGGFVLVTATLGDGESYRFAQQIDAVLREAGWDSRLTPSVSYQVPPKGLMIVVRSQDALPAYFRGLIEALQQAQLSPQIVTSNDEGPGYARIIVGPKP